MSIKHSIEVDLKWNSTPDLPTLRYAGAIPVFFWDSLTKFDILGTILSSLDISKHYQSQFHQALTMNDYLPWYNMCKDKFTYDTYCLEDYAESEDVDLPSYSIGQPQRMVGKMCLVSLEALQELDVYYENELHFTRSVIPVLPSRFSVQPKACYTWLNTSDQVFEFDTVRSEYVLSKHIDVTPFNTANPTKDVEFYQY